MLDLTFDSSVYEVKTITMEGATITYRAFMNREYCTYPVDPIQKLHLFAPEAYFHGEKINGYDLHSAPIFLPNSVGGYKEGAAKEPGKEFTGKPNSIFFALLHGYVVASIGVRGSDTKDGIGKAPALIVDMKAGIRYLRKNKEKIPGNTDRMITNGTSAGGALSAMTGASGNHPDYELYLKSIGAAMESDSVFASNCYCPIHNLENADTAYEWLFGNCTYFETMHFEKSPEGDRIMVPVHGAISREQEALARELAAMFPSYVNQLGLRDEDGAKLTLLPDGSGSFADYVSCRIADAANQRLHGVTYSSENKESDVLSNPALTIENGKVTGVNLPLYATTIKRMKCPPAFDALDLSSPENIEFGDEKVKARHFTDFGSEHAPLGKRADPAVVRMLNPLSYIDDAKADTAMYWRIRHGSYDRDTSLAIPAILALKLQNAGYRVNFALPWGVVHSGDYDLTELFAWIDEICAGA